jgi:Protein of unknown function (DUF3465)
MTLNKIIAVAVFSIVAATWYYHQPADRRSPIAQAPGPGSGWPDGPDSAAQHATFGDQAARALADRANGRMIAVQATVQRLLADDRQGSPHQRFVVRTASGQTLLVTHNVALAPRLDGLRPGDTVSIFGEYIWNIQGGLLHWTHRDPGGQHAAGFIDWQGRRYQ